MKHPFIRTCGAASLALLVMSATEARISDDQRRYSYELFNDVELGRGWDSAKGRLATDICIEFGEEKIPYNKYEGSMRLVAD
ncbi:MAG: hypothetical protein AAF465_17390, partial [Pseudomonadota bacterium]